MITLLFFLFLAISTLLAFRNWRHGLYLLILVGVLQDPVRKMMPGAPSYMVLGFLPVWLAVALNFFLQEKDRMRFWKENHGQLYSRMGFIVLTLLPAGLVMIYNYGIVAWPAVVLGTFGYLSPLLAFLLGALFPKDEEQLQRLLVFYCLVSCLALTGGLLEYLQVMPDWKVLGTGVLNTRWVKYVSYGHTIYMKAGFFRSPDIMGWHAASLVMISLTMLFYGRSRIPRWLWLALVVWGGINLVICGRYKMTVMPMIWGAVISFVYWYKGQGKRIAMVAMVAIVVVSGVLGTSSNVGVGSDYILYASSPLSYSFERLDKHGVDAVLTTYRQSGFFGKGLGSGTQGAHNFGIRQSWQEGGLSKIMVELGVMGFLAFILFAVALTLAVRRLVLRLDMSSQHAHLAIGLLGFSAANSLAFVVSHQAYSDGLIMILTAFTFGLVFVVMRWSAYSS